MALDATLTVIAASEYRKSVADPHYIPKSGAKFELYRDWHTLDSALNKIGAPVSLAMRGNRPGPFAFDEDWDAYFSHATAGLVKKIDKALGKVSDEEFLAALREAGWRFRKRDEGSHLGSLETVKAAYRAAAKKSACLQILIC
jgi:hypothetical protein